MARNETTSAIVDSILKLLIGGGAITTMVVLPNSGLMFDKPLRVFFNKMDKRAREREMRRVLSYMKKQNLITLAGDDYEHGIRVTKAGKDRARRANFERLAIAKPKRWDGKWRIVFFDIPESYKVSRDALTFKLKRMGFLQLQRSVWIHPFACRNEVETVTLHFSLNRYITYIETEFIENQKALIKRFKHLL